jgi:hypothetical protein
MVGFHLIEGRVSEQECHGAMDVLHDRGFSSLGENYVFCHRRLVTDGRPWVKPYYVCVNYAMTGNSLPPDVCLVPLGT